MTETLNDLIEKRFGQKLAHDHDSPAEGIHAQQLDHRSRRRYTDEPVADDLLELMFACALSAPAKSDLQQVSIINLADASQRNRVTDLIPSMPWIKQAPVFLLFCGDSRRIRRLCDYRGTSFEHEPLDAFLNAATDAAIVMQNFIVAAEGAGLGCCPISGVREVTEDIADIVKLPDHVFPFVGLCVGHPADAPWISQRLPLELTVHTDVYNDDNLLSEADAYDRRRSAANPISRQRDTEKFGEREQYGWSDDKARQTSHKDRLSFSRYIKRSGFETLG